MNNINMNRGILERTLINKLSDELNYAIKQVGGNTNNVMDIFDFSDVIKQQLTAYFDVIAGAGIDVHIEYDNDTCNDSCHCGCSCGYESDEKRPKSITITANSKALLNNDIIYNDNIIAKKGDSIQDVFNILFDNYLPRSIKSGHVDGDELVLVTDNVDNIVINTSIFVKTDDIKYNTRYIGESETNPLKKVFVMDSDGKKIEPRVGDFVSYEEKVYALIDKPIKKWVPLSGSDDTINTLKEKINEIETTISNHTDRISSLEDKINIMTDDDAGIIIRYRGFVKSLDPIVLTDGTHLNNIKKGDIILYENMEYIFDGNNWQMFGSDPALVSIDDINKIYGK